MPVEVVESTSTVEVEEQQFQIVADDGDTVVVEAVAMSLGSLEVTEDAAALVTVTEDAPAVVQPVVDSPPEIIELVTAGPEGVPGLPGPAGPANLVVGPINTLTEPGIWVQTGLGLTGNDWTLWIEDGTP